VPRVGQIFMEDTTLIRRRAKEFDDEIEASIAQCIRMFRGRAGYRQVDLAAAIGAERNAISRIERGTQQVRAGLLMRIAIQCRTPIGMFFIPPGRELETGWEPRRAEPQTPYWVDLMFERGEFPEEHPFYDRW
jgi:transcriptional regulator with XRE-family HTH domain